jgi:hypothetical protein
MSLSTRLQMLDDTLRQVSADCDLAISEEQVSLNHLGPSFGDFGHPESGRAAVVDRGSHLRGCLEIRDALIRHPERAERLPQGLRVALSKVLSLEGMVFWIIYRQKELTR